MPLGLVHFQHMTHLSVKLWIHHTQALGHVFMYGGLADMKSLRGRTDGRSVFKNKFAQLHRPFFYGTLHLITPYIVFCTLYEVSAQIMHSGAFYRKQFSQQSRQRQD